MKCAERELGAQYLVEGSLHKMGNRLAGAANPALERPGEQIGGTAGPLRANAGPDVGYRAAAFCL